MRVGTGGPPRSLCLCLSLSLTSAMNCSAPPRSTMVEVWAHGHPLKRLKRSPPTCFSSNVAHEPITSGTTLFTVVCDVTRRFRARASVLEDLSESTRLSTQPTDCTTDHAEGATNHLGG